jgi:hypothetical protein
VSVLQLPARITALACKGDHTYAAVGSTIIACRRVHQMHMWRGHSGSILQLLLFGDFLLSLADDNTLQMWRLDHLSDEAEVSAVHIFARCRHTMSMHDGHQRMELRIRNVADVIA